MNSTSASTEVVSVGLLLRPMARLFCISFVLLSALGCYTDSKPKSVKPAKVEAHPTEADIYRITLTAKAEERLQISTVPIERKSIPRHRSLGGDIIVPDGSRISVTAPLTGTLAQIGDSALVVAGQKVTAKQPLLKLLAILRPEQEVPTAAERVQMANARASLISQQIQASGNEKQAKAQVDGAQIAFDRASKLLEDKAGSRRQVDEAEAILNVAKKGLEAATEQRQLLDQLTLEATTGEAPLIIIDAPQAGTIQTVSAQSGQVVSAGSPLFDIVDLNNMWVRVPVYAGLVQDVNLSENAAVGPLSGNGDTVSVSPVTAPPTATALSSSIDLYYAIDNSNGKFRPGERVSVNIPLNAMEDTLVIPRAAVLRDIHGTAWVYIKSGEHEFRRERVAVIYNTKELAVLSLGPKVGTPVVVDGAAELFGTEFGAGK